MREAKRPGRPTDKPMTKFIKARVTEDDHAKYIDLGGSEWLREQIEAASIEKPETEVAQHE